ncbi:MAG: SUMF1/EgtB/PvdO family nonheme iron enzyme [Candidatus Sumerlaeota bacterium]|nr:SUMF1/EgtB/PvdO family nonheme iron enzyme [Candidatus Sumerlaeota bacterium]
MGRIRAATWDGATHWIYGFQSDTISTAQCNYKDGVSYANPLGLTSVPYTSPVGWFNGVNISLNGAVQTINSPSPVGAYDMSGNIFEWRHDWYAAYDSAPQINPVGPDSGGSRVVRGGGWFYAASFCRTAFRLNLTPGNWLNNVGFCVARSVPAP